MTKKDIPYLIYVVCVASIIANAAFIVDRFYPEPTQYKVSIINAQVVSTEKKETDKHYLEIQENRWLEVPRADIVRADLGKVAQVDEPTVYLSPKFYYTDKDEVISAKEGIDSQTKTQ